MTEAESITMTRRETLASGSAVLLALGFPAALSAQDVTAEQAMAAFSKGAVVKTGRVMLTLGDVAEDGFKVPIEVAADGAEALMIIAPENPVPPVALISFGSLAVGQRFSTRIRLARTQAVIALARMPDGSVFQTTQNINVVVGGCGA